MTFINDTLLTYSQLLAGITVTVGVWLALFFGDM